MRDSRPPVDLRQCGCADRGKWVRSERRRGL